MSSSSRNTRRASDRRSRSGSGLRFTVVVEFLAGLLGIYGIGRLLARRIKEARFFLLISLLLIVPLDFTPRLFGDEYAIWIPWVVKAVLAALSALHLNYMLDRKDRAARAAKQLQDQAPEPPSRSRRR